MSFEGWLMIGVVVYIILAFTIVIFLGSIDVIDEDNGKIIFVCLAVPPASYWSFNSYRILFYIIW